jgi:SET domain-containing protein
VVVQKSSVHGNGLFARKRLRTGSYIGTFEGRATRRDGEHVLWVLEEGGSARGLRVDNELRFLNHSSHPNAELEGTDLFALRNIQPGREIHIHYGDDWGDIE